MGSVGILHSEGTLFAHFDETVLSSILKPSVLVRKFQAVLLSVLTSIYCIATKKTLILIDIANFACSNYWDRLFKARLVFILG